ncbi:MAG TPA: hypothetical protein VJA21_10775 [Verrucomicrobiae bacterium]
MKMTAADIKKYPKFAHYVRHDVPDLIYVPSVMHNLKTKGHLTDAESRHALRWGHEPLIVITDLSGGQCGVPSAYGCTRKAKHNQIEIDEGTVKDFETSPDGLGVGKNAKGKNVYIVGVTLLHELCHVGHYRHGKAEKAEAGFAFENAAYGKSVP